MEGARVVSTTTVKAVMSLQEPIIHRIELTPWDLQHLFMSHMQQGVLFHKSTCTQDENSNSVVIHRLKNSLSRTLDLFSPLAGRLAETKYDDDDDTCSFSIICNNAGAEFVHAVTNGVTIADILDPIYVPSIVHSFFPLHDVVGYKGISTPLLAVQVTDLVDGIFIGCTMNHVVADGTSFWHFFNSWSEISRGLDNNATTNNLPILQRWFLDGIHYPIRFRIPKGSENISERSSDNNTSQALTRERVFHFTKEKIAALKSKANAEMGNSQISSLQALLAHLGRSIFRNRGLEPHEEIFFVLPIDCRPRLHPPLPNEYFGNSIYFDVLTIKAGELLERGLGYVALQMSKMVASQTNETAKNFFESWVKDPKITIPSRVVPKSNTTLLIGNSPRFNVYDTDFGWGRPIAARYSIAGPLHDGLISMLPGVEEGSIDIQVCMFVETLEAMGNDQEFMNAVTQEEFHR